MVCHSCGATNPPDKRFCGDCGAPLAVVCPSCGATNPPDKRFCGDCGTALGGVVRPAAALSDHPAGGPGGSAAVRLAEGAPGSAPGHESERRLVTVLFADLVGFTPFAEGRDAEEVRETLSRYFELAREIVGRYGGRIEKFVGDAVMAVWGAPVAQEDDAERAVRAGLDLLEVVASLAEGIQARCGVVTGEAAVTVAAVGEGMVAGDIVNTAARLQSAAPPGAVLVGEETHRAAARAIAFEAAGDQTLKGKAAPVAAWRALRVVAERRGRNRTEALEAPFVGRAEELRLLKDLFHATSREQRPRLVSVLGPAGIGKTRLAWEFLKYVDGLVEPVWWHEGRSPAYGEGIAFWALGEMVRGRCGLLETDDEPTTRSKVAGLVGQQVRDEAEGRWIERALLALLGVESDVPSEQLFAAWRAFFERLAASAPVVMVFEDLHHADPGLLDFIDSLLDWSRTSPIYVVTLARPELLEKRPAWGAAKRSFVSVYLEPLPETAMRELLGGLAPGLPETAVAAIVERADGVPLYAVETVRMLVADGRLRLEGGRYAPAGDLAQLAVPATLTALIGARLDALDPDDRALVQDAAVLGQSLTIAALAAVSGFEPAELEPRLGALVRREILALAADPRSPERGQFVFVQAMIREVAYRTLARRDRKLRHLAAARYFEALGSDELAGALAGHYVAARADATEAAEAAALATQARLALAGAGDRAAALGSHDSAVSFLRRAVEVSDDPGHRAPLLERAGTSAAKGGRCTQAEALFEEAIAIHEQADDVEGVARATAELGTALLHGWQEEKAVARLTAVRERLDDGVRPEARAQVLATLSRAYMRAGRFEASVAAADEALGITERLRLDELTAEAMVNKASSLDKLGRLEEPIALFEGARVIARRGGWSTLELRATNNLAAAVVTEDLRRTAALGEEALPMAVRVGDRSMATFLAWGIAVTRFNMAEGWDEVIADLDARLATDLEPGDRGALLGSLIDFRAARGAVVDDQLAELASLVGPSANRDLREHALTVQGRAALLHGDLEAARGALEAAVASGSLHDLVRSTLVEVALHQGDAQRIRTEATRQAGNPAISRRVHAASLRYANGCLAALEGRSADAIAEFAAASALAGAASMVFLVASIGLSMAATLDVSDPDVAAAISTSREIWGSVGASAWLDRLDAVLESRAGSRPGEPALPARPAT